MIADLAEWILKILIVLGFIGAAVLKDSILLFVVSVLVIALVVIESSGKER
jgi:hypothetical protein